MASEARLRANNNYVKHNVKKVSIAFYPKDKEIYAWVAQHESMAGYIRELIVKDMQAKRGGKHEA